MAKEKETPDQLKVELPKDLEAACTPEQRATIGRFLGFGRQVAGWAQKSWGITVVTSPDCQKITVSPDGTANRV